MSGMTGQRGYEELFHRHGDNPILTTAFSFTFPCGYTLDADGDTLNLYYGAADTSVALATGSVRNVLRWLDEQRSESQAP